MAAVFVDYARPFDSVDHGCIARGFCPLALGSIGGVDRWLPEGAHGEGAGEQGAVGGCRPHLWCPSRLGPGTAAVHCHGGFAEQAAQLRP
ncbi:hypothetical protein ERJ75_000813200 [Trypanosoma vivax]|nr:hypothetical protein ERJ75_000813200 [Trypanosoma vivax]